MSAFGPALFVSRNDGEPLDAGEQSAILAAIRSVSPQARFYDYDEYESGALGVLLHSAYGYQHLPDEVREDQDQAWAEEGRRVAAVIDSDVYTYVSYPVED